MYPYFFHFGLCRIEFNSLNWSSNILQHQNCTCALRNKYTHTHIQYENWLGFTNIFWTKWRVIQKKSTHNNILIKVPFLEFIKMYVRKMKIYFISLCFFIFYIFQMNIPCNFFSACHFWSPFNAYIVRFGMLNCGYKTVFSTPSRLFKH